MEITNVEIRYLLNKLKVLSEICETDKEKYALMIDNKQMHEDMLSKLKEIKRDYEDKEVVGIYVATLKKVFRYSCLLERAIKFHVDALPAAIVAHVDTEELINLNKLLERVIYGSGYH